MLSKFLLNGLVICLLVLSTSRASVDKKRKFFLYDAAFTFNTRQTTPLNLILNLHFRKYNQKKESVHNYFYTYQNAIIEDSVPYKMRVLLPYPVEKSTEVNFRWALKDEFDEEFECALTIRKVTFINNDTAPVDFCPVFKDTVIEPYASTPLIRCNTFV